MKNNLYESLGLRRVINASGKMTALGVSTVSDDVASSMVNAAQNFVEIEKLYAAAGAKVARMIECEDVCIVNSASAGLAMCVSSLICKDDLSMVEDPYSKLAQTRKRDVIMLKGQNVNYGAPVSTMVQLGLGVVKEVGYANKSTRYHIENAIDEQTLAILYVVSHHCVIKNMISVDEVIQLGKKHGIPVIVDAAAEENLSMYTKLGASMVVYSGAKAISGPTSGLVACSEKVLASNLRLQFKGIGRAMKVGKESIMGLLTAIENYPPDKNELEKNLLMLDHYINQLNQVPGIYSQLAQDRQGRDIKRIKIHVTSDQFGCDAIQLSQKLTEGNPAIYSRDHYANVGVLELDLRGLSNEEDLDLIVERIMKTGGK